MIIECTNCNKKFNVNDELIPSNGRQIKCGSCNHSWHFKIEKLSDKTPAIKSENTTHDELVNKSNEKNFEIFSETKTSKLNENDEIKDENIIADVTNVKNKRKDQGIRKKCTDSVKHRVTVERRTNSYRKSQKPSDHGSNQE